MPHASTIISHKIVWPVLRNKGFLAAIDAWDLQQTPGVFPDKEPDKPHAVQRLIRPWPMCSDPSQALYAITLFLFCLVDTDLRLDLCSGPLRYLDVWLSWVDLNFLPGRPGGSFVAVWCVRVSVVNKNRCEPLNLNQRICSHEFSRTTCFCGPRVFLRCFSIRWYAAYLHLPMHGNWDAGGE